MALAGASPGPAGTGRAQLQLPQNLLSTNSYVLQKPLVQIGEGTARFDDDLRLVDAATRDLVQSQLVALMDWAARVGGPAPADVAIWIG